MRPVAWSTVWPSVFQSTYDQAPELLETAGLRPARMRSAAFAESFDFQPNPLQQSLIDELPGHVTGRVCS